MDYNNAFTGLARKFSFTKDRSLEFYFSMEAAKKGSPFGKFLVGNRFKNGEGIKQSFDKAAEWYKLAF
jgi:TPR repeat protein